MTDNEINARVAALRGDTIAQDTHGWYIVGEDGHYWPPPAYCTDPAAWGALLVWLAKQHNGALLPWLSRQPGHWTALVMCVDTIDVVSVNDLLPGRALALAALRAYGVEV